MNEKSSLLRTEKDRFHTVEPATATITASTRDAASNYPTPFLDPVTYKVMKDPVVAPFGTSYERSSWETLCRNGTVSSAPAYENRALKQLIQAALIKKKDIRQGNFRRSSQMLNMKVQHSLRKSVRQLMEKSILPTVDRKWLSDVYYCPITMSLMKHPVISPEGFSFEKEAIEQWIDKNQLSPLTRTPLPDKKLLYPNHALEELLKLEVSKLPHEDKSLSIREFQAYMMNQESSYQVPRTFEDWKTLRNRQRKSNIQFTYNGIIQFFLLIIIVVLGFVMGILLGVVALAVATVLDLLVAPVIHCFCPGGCHGGSDPFDDEVPFINLSMSDSETEEDERIRH